ncbi:SRPBCC family protein [Streptomyces sp. ODS28]|uniref:SRPBCC family protein n=1 Tax=Streptomyces sp. ODS28 TaxID=3136688 RepID=UPI0031E9EDFF
MVRRLRPVELEFADTAPVRLAFTATLRSSPEEVYVALAEEVENTPRWFSAVAEAVPTGGGRGRDVKLRGGVRFSETVLAALAVQRYAYRIDTANVPGVTAMLEDWRLAPDGLGGTLVRWTMAVDGGLPVRLVLRLARPGVGRSFHDAMRALDAYLGAPDTSRSGGSGTGTGTAS